MGITAVIANTEESGGGIGILIPALPDLLWGSVSFVILLVLFSKFVLPSFNKVLAERAEKIEGGLIKAERAQAEAQAALAEYTEQLALARTEAASIRTAAAEEKKAIVDEAKSAAASEAAAVTARGLEQLRAEQSQVASALQREVGALALELASKVVGASLHDDARAREVVDAFIADLERQASEAGR